MLCASIMPPPCTLACNMTQWGARSVKESRRAVLDTSVLTVAKTECEMPIWKRVGSNSNK